MAYEKYTISDGFTANLDTSIGLSDTTLLLQTAQGDGLPSGTQKTILKVVQYTTANDTTTAIVKSENIICTNRSGDTLTVTRNFDGTNSTFNAGDYIYCTNHTAVIEDIQDEVTRLETDKADDDTVVHISGGEIITGNKTFEGTTETKNINTDGLITATSFSGDGSGLTNVTSTTSRLQSILSAGEDMPALSVYRRGNLDIKLEKTNEVNHYTQTATSSGPGNYTEITLTTINAGVIPEGQRYFRLRSDLYKQLNSQSNDEIRIRVYQGASVIFERESDVAGWATYDDEFQPYINGLDDITIAIYQYERPIQYRNIYLDTFDWIRENTEKFYLAKGDDIAKTNIKGICISSAEAGADFFGSFKGIISGFSNLNPTNGTIEVIDSTIEGKLYNETLPASDDNIGNDVYLQDDGTIGLTPGTLGGIIVGTVFSDTQILIDL